MNNYSTFEEIKDRCEQRNTSIDHLQATSKLDTIVVVFADGTQANVTDETFDDLLANATEATGNLSTRKVAHIVPQTPVEKEGLLARVNKWLEYLNLTRYRNTYF
jgi:hypothetical protein